MLMNVKLVLGTTATVDRLVAEGWTWGSAVQAATVARNDYREARKYLKRYRQPHGEDRLRSSKISTRRHNPPLSCQFEDSFSAPGSRYDYDRLCDPAQIIDTHGTTIAYLAQRTVRDAGANTEEDKACALYDLVKQKIAYEYNRVQYGVTNYWASAAETWTHKKGDCACQAILFGALCQGAGLATRHVCVPNHAFCQVLLSDMHPDRVLRWYRSGHVKTFKGTQSLYPKNCGVNYWVATLKDGRSRVWLVCDLTMCNYAGARGCTFPPKGTAGTGVVATKHGWDYPSEWKGKRGGRSVTYRYPDDRGTRFEWMVTSRVDGGRSKFVGRGICFRKDEHSDDRTDNDVIEYCAACDIFLKADRDGSGLLEGVEIERLLREMLRKFSKDVSERIRRMLRAESHRKAVSFDEFMDTWRAITTDVNDEVPLCALSESACRDAAKALGLMLGGHGYPFADDYPTKGLYAYKSGKYAGTAFYGRGASSVTARSGPVRPPKYRPRESDLPLCARSETACRDAAKALGLKLGGRGYPFAGDYPTKGLYAYSGGKYAGIAFYGRSSSFSERLAPVRKPKYRPLTRERQAALGRGVFAAALRE
eukprot:g3162.t1